ncbi:3-deoxy-7-phosphoheptulonate synthase [bacterium]|nr:3-deoxy-7-phosphoheptulonate synthase [bacterium]
MLIFMRNSASESDVNRVVERLDEFNLNADVLRNGTAAMIYVKDDSVEVPSLSAFNGIERIVHTEARYKLASRNHKPEDTIIEVGDRRIGGGNFCVMAGPCAVESVELGLEIASLLKSENLALMRGGAFKPRTSPYSFQGLEYEGLDILVEIRKQTGVLVVTEAIDVNSVGRVEKIADAIQVGSRNMQNFSLLKRLGKTSKPILLKRGMSATIEELLLAAEYIISGGNENVILCERGIRTFGNFARNTLDLSIIPAVKEKSHLPIIVDPSHATGKRNFISSMSKAALAAGADGLLIEVHTNPELSLSDGGQSLNPDEFKSLMVEIRKLASVMNVNVN